LRVSDAKNVSGVAGGMEKIGECILLPREIEVQLANGVDGA